MRVAAFLLEVLFQWLVGAALLRAWMNGLRVNMRAQPGVFVMALTDWIVKPLRRGLPRSVAKARVDWGSVLAALILALTYALLGRLLLSGAALALPGAWVWAGVPGLALVFLARTALQMCSVLVIGAVLVSWLQRGSALDAMLSRLADPLLAPLRRAVPPIGGLDLTPMLVLLLLQVGVMLLQ
ncbi:MAG: YggT family protein [Betaproteobacteria bacterium]